MLSHNCRLTLVMIAIAMVSQFQIYQLAAINNVYKAASGWLLSEYQNNGRIVATMWAVMSSSFSMGKMFGTILSSFMADRLGRRVTLIYVAVTLIISSLIMALAHPILIFELLIFGRLLAGVAVGVALSVSVLMASEAPPMSQRGYFTGLIIIFLSIGDLTGLTVSLPFLLGTAQLWTLALVFAGIPAIVFLPILFWSRESPRFLYFMTNDSEKTIESIVFYQGEKNVDIALAELENEKLMLSQSEVLKWTDFWTNPSLRHATVLATLLMTSCCFIGITGIVTYSTIALESSGLPLFWASLGTLLVGISKTITGFPCGALVEKFGRRPMALLGYLGCGFAILFIILSDLMFEKSHLTGGLVVCALCIFMLFYSFLAVAVFAQAPELFLQYARSKGMVISFALTWFVAAIDAAIFPQLHYDGGNALAFLPYLLGAIFMFIYMYNHMPETRMMTFSEIQSRYFERERLLSTMPVDSSKYRHQQVAPQSDDRTPMIVDHLTSTKNNVDIASFDF